jgi:hypothetical protein
MRRTRGSQPYGIAGTTTVIKVRYYAAQTRRPPAQARRDAAITPIARRPCEDNYRVCRARNVEGGPRRRTLRQCPGDSGSARVAYV